jgi:hypothetical protein
LCRPGRGDSTHALLSSMNTQQVLEPAHVVSKALDLLLHLNSHLPPWTGDRRTRWGLPWGLAFWALLPQRDSGLCLGEDSASPHAPARALSPPCGPAGPCGSHVQPHGGSGWQPAESGPPPLGSAHGHMPAALHFLRGSLGPGKDLCCTHTSSMCLPLPAALSCTIQPAVAPQCQVSRLRV